MSDLTLVEQYLIVLDDLRVYLQDRSPKEVDLDVYSEKISAVNYWHKLYLRQEIPSFYRYLGSIGCDVDLCEKVVRCHPAQQELFS